ncbi:MAG: S1 RNA-binding domain-containing protein [Eubacterium sp.]|nr:S1 RNA-binding domain-containing protein [Eubacterium sp.]
MLEMLKLWREGAGEAEIKGQPGPGKRIAAIDASDIETEERVRQREFIDLRELESSGRVTEGRVYSLFTMEDTQADILGVFAQLQYGRSRFQVRIAAEDFCPWLKTPGKNQLMKNGETPRQFARRYIRNHISATIHYCVKQIVPGDGGEMVIYASRLEAMGRLARQYYFNPDPQGCIQVGDEVLGRIVSTHTHSLMVEVAGVETYIEAGEVSWGYHLDYRREEKYQVGQKLWVKVLELERNERDKRVTHLRVSGRQAQINPKISEIENFRVDGEYPATVVRHLETGSIVAFEDSEMDGFVTFSTQFERPAVGQRVLVRLLRVDRKHLKLYGFVTTKMGMR